MSGIKITKADRKFSLMIRERDEWTCQRCGKTYVPPTKALHAMHNHSRACKRCTTKRPTPHVCARLDPSNALAGCYGCHMWIDSHPADKERLFRFHFGDEEYDRVAALAHGRRDRVRMTDREDRLVFSHPPGSIEGSHLVRDHGVRGDAAVAHQHLDPITLPPGIGRAGLMQHLRDWHSGRTYPK